MASSESLSSFNDSNGDTIILPCDPLLTAPSVLLILKTSGSDFSIRPVSSIPPSAIKSLVRFVSTNGELEECFTSPLMLLLLLMLLRFSTGSTFVGNDALLCCLSLLINFFTFSFVSLNPLLIMFFSFSLSLSLSLSFSRSINFLNPPNGAL